MPLLQASVVTGFEVVAADEVQTKLNTKCFRTRGRIRFEIEKNSIKDSLRLRSIENIYYVILDRAIDGLPEMDHSTALATVSSLLPECDWNKAIKIWQIAHERDLNDDIDANSRVENFVRTGEHHKVTENSTKFRVTCNRAGPRDAHSFTSDDAAKVFGSRINESLGWKADMKNFDIEVVVQINKEWITVMIALNFVTLFKRNIIAFGPTTLRATMCYGLMALARPSPGDVIIDPMCGGGSIPIEGALAFPQSIFIGSDFHEKAIERCIANSEFVSSFPCRVPSFFYADATLLPLKDESVDAIVTDLPFGKKIGSVTDNRVLYPRLLKEWSRIARPKARLVVLTHDKRSWENAVRAQFAWRPLDSRNINVGGLQSIAMILSRC